MWNAVRTMTAVFLAACAVTLANAAPVEAVGFRFASGYHGYWAGSERGMMKCVEHQRLIFHAGPSITRTAAYPNSVQTIWIQPRLEQYVNGVYNVVVSLSPALVTTHPNQVANYPSSWNGDFTIYKYGVYRVTYLVGWYVGGRLVGSALFGHYNDEIWIDWGGASSGGSGQKILYNGCTMNPGLTWVG